MKKILIIDDSAAVRILIQRELEDGDFDMREASNGEEALRIIPEFLPDLITLDVEMPGLNGYETCSKIRSGPDKIRDIPVIFLTSFDTMEQRKQGFIAGASDFITKPFVPGELYDTVNRILYPEEQLSDINALVVDDDNTIRHIVSECLKEMGISVFTASSGEEALKKINSTEDDIDLIITDLEMPGINGDELCRKIRNELGMKDIPVIFLSNISKRSSILDMFKAGATDYINKPFVKEELLARVKIHLQARVLNRELQKKVLDLKGLNKLKDDFLSIASHDLRSPIAGILGSIDFLLQNDKITDNEMESLTNIKNSSNYLLSLVNDILDLSRIQSENAELEKVPVSVIVTAESCVEILKYMAGPKGIKIKVNTGDVDYSVISGDANALTRIFNNLLSNAIKFTPENGHVDVLFSVDNENIAIDVKDTGIGISKNEIGLLFDKFTKSSRSGTSGEKGTGLGLTITKELVERLGGTIEVSSVVNKGTCFRLCFKLMPKEELDRIGAEDTDEISCLTVNEELRFLIVEDDSVSVKIITAILSKMRISADAVSDGAIVLQKYGELLKQGQSDFYDLILMDMNMPEVGGVEAAKKIRQMEQDMKVRQIPIVALTAGISQKNKDLCFEAGMNEYLSKPIKKTELIRVLNKLLG